MIERHGLSQRRACELVGLDRSTLRYQCRRLGRLGDQATPEGTGRGAAALRVSAARMDAGSAKGHTLNHKKLYRLYREERLMVRRRRRAQEGIRNKSTDDVAESRINQRWSLDFVSDTLSDGRRFRILCIVDDYSRECLATVVDTSLGGVRVVRELERLADRASHYLRRWLATTEPN